MSTIESKEEIKTLIKEFEENEIIRSSIIIGLTNKDFTKDKLEKLKETFGFQQAIPLPETPEGIYRAIYCIYSLRHR
ncbi:hypothetical protein K8R42_01420 [bacterium]|nr:hypothetical protein [bacterium]